MKKVTLFFVASLVSILAFDYFNFSKIVCDSYSCISKINGILLGWFILSIINIVILLTLRFLPVNCFAEWWKFARISIFVTAGTSLLVGMGLHHSPGGWFNIDDEIDLTINSLIFVIFILGSLIQIYRGYRK